MSRKTAKKKLFVRAIDVLGTRAGTALGLVILMAFVAMAGLQEKRLINTISADHDLLDQRQLRLGYAAMSDLQRLLFATRQEAWADVTDRDALREFEMTIDVLSSRTDVMYRIFENAAPEDPALMATEALSDVVDVATRVADRSLPAGQDPQRELLSTSRLAEERLRAFLDETLHLQGQVLDGQIETLYRQRDAFFASLLALALIGVTTLLLLRREIVARHARDAAEAHVSFLAYFDPLTDLPNRMQFQERLAKLLNKQRAVALLLIDLDEFKGINDTFGHAAGDAVLKHVGGVLDRQASQANGFAARLGGDEFALVVRSDRSQRLTLISEAILREVRAGVEFEGERIDISVSIGIANNTQLGPSLARSVDMLCRVCDFALYASKSAGRGKYTQYNAQLEERFKNRRALLQALPHAVAEGELQTFLQPKVLLPHGEIYGFEALVRWQRDGRIVSPEEFINVAEESGMIVEIDRFILRDATQILAAFNGRHGTRFCVSVNLSAIHFTNRRIVEQVRQALVSSGLEPDLLTLEITETVEIRDWYHAQSIVSDLRNLGVRIAIDDFGTGYSSLGYLRTVTADELKIDRSLVEKIETSDKARFLLDAVLDMADNLQFGVVVEGVETEQQARVLHEMGAQCAQGFYYGRPQPAAMALNALVSSSALRATFENATVPRLARA